MNDHMSIQQLAELSGKSISTIRRHKAKLEAAGAYCGRPAWRITTEHAIKAGLLDDQSMSAHVTNHDYSPDYSPDNSAETALREQLELTKAALEREKSRADLLETLLQQEKQEKLLWLKGYLEQTKAISAPTEEPEATTVATTVTTTQPEEEAQQPFWKRIFRRTPHTTPTMQ